LVCAKLKQLNAATALEPLRVLPGNMLENWSKPMTMHGQVGPQAMAFIVSVGGKSCGTR